MTSRLETFRALHAAGCFVMPNPWDAGSARYLAHLGFKALATTSAGMAFSRGRSDALGRNPRDDVLAHIRELAMATALPLNADFQDGYAREPEAVAANVALCVQTGCAGLSLEDATGDTQAPLHERDLAIDRIRAARAAIDSSGHPVVLTARCEAFLVGAPRPLDTVLDRLVAFADAGADCLFAPGLRDPDSIATVVKAVAPKPLNVLVSRPAPDLTVARLRDLGVRRISIGPALALAAWGGLMRAAQQLALHGTFDGFEGNATFGEVDKLFS